MASERILNEQDSKERVAFDLMEKILNEEWTDGRRLQKEQILDLYAECHYAASGYRKYAGK